MNFWLNSRLNHCCRIGIISFCFFNFFFTSGETSQIQIRHKNLWFWLANSRPMTAFLLSFWKVISCFFVKIRKTMLFLLDFWSSKEQMTIFQLSHFHTEHNYFSEIIFHCVKKICWKFLLKNCPRVSDMKVRRIYTKVSTNRLASAGDFSKQVEFTWFLTRG